MVLWARLELAHLAALPPQDSVSTNFTTRASSMYQAVKDRRKGERILMEINEIQKITVELNFVKLLMK
jgi:hypothetical protein